MKIDIVSDIHLTHHKDHGAEWVAELVPKGEVLIIAGDVGEFHWWMLHLQHIQTLGDKYQEVLFVAGNHDYYGTSLAKGDERFRQIEDRVPNFHFLERDTLEIGGVTFAGCSLWFKEDPVGQIYEKWMSDFQLIHDFKPSVYQRNKESQEFLRGLQDVDVVITHHMFSQRSVHPKYEGDPNNVFFLCAMDDAIVDLQPKFAIHGHTHSPCDYQLGTTRVIGNPRGYPRERPGVYAPVTIEL